jgi:Flp pilus assembly protein TadD/TolB-like protein
MAYHSRSLVMNSMKKQISVLVLVVVSWISPASPARAADRVLVLPFENLSEASLYNWLGEAMTLALSDLLSFAQVPVISLAERRAAYQRMGFATATMLSRASALRIAREIGAQVLVWGAYEVIGNKSDERVQITARLIHVQEGRVIGEELTAGAPLSEWLDLQGTLAWEILSSQRATPIVSRKEMNDKARAIPQPAFEYYVKALLTDDQDFKIKLLTTALKEFNKVKPYDKYPQALLELGKTQCQSKQFAEAISSLSQILTGAPHEAEARFYLGVAYYETGDLNNAIAAFQKLLSLTSTAVAYTNLAAAELKLGRLANALPHFSMAVSIEDENPDYRFNYGYALWLYQDYENAIAQLRHAVRQRGGDGQARYLLGKCLQKLGRAEEAQEELKPAQKTLTTFSQWESSGKIPVLVRFKTTLD